MLLFILGVALLHELDGLVPGQDERLDGQVGLDDFLHLFFNGQQILIGELFVTKVYIVVKALFRGGAIGKVRVRVQVLNGLGHDVGRGVPQNVQRFLRGALCYSPVFVDDFHNISPFLSVGMQKSTPGFSKGALVQHGSTLTFHS